MGEPPRRCSSCGESYAESALFCPRDGSALLSGHRSEPSDPYTGLTLQGAFRVEALIGSGAMGRVYRAHQLGLERAVALKIMHRELASNPELVGRFQREGRIAGTLNHPHIVSALLSAEFEHEGLPIPFLVLEYLSGLSLRSALLGQGRLPLPRALHILLQIADAVGEAHQHGIVHRDLKPENVMLVNRGGDPDFVKVLDFGVARFDSDVAGVMATRAGAIFGSARYVAPECAAGNPSTKASDVYALATLGYECLCGTTPFDGENAIQILLAQQNSAVPPLSERTAENVPPALALVIERNLAKAPEARARDARLFAHELIDAASDALPALGLSSRTRRGHAVHKALLAVESSPRNAVRAPAAPGGAKRRAAFVVLCFTLGVGFALGIAAKLGALGETSRSAVTNPSSGAP